MIIGIDFDNTIINYDNLFFEAGLSLGILSNDECWSKTAIRSYLIEHGLEYEWIEIQGLVYGKLIHKAKVMDGFFSFINNCSNKSWDIYIISHKTRKSVDGKGYDLHNSAIKWLEEKGICNYVKGVFFEPTREKKISRINHLGCTIMIDDLPEVLLHPDLAIETTKILYDPGISSFTNINYYTAAGWDQIDAIVTELYG